MGRNGGAGRNHPRFTPDEVTSIVAAYQNGATVHDLAVAYDVTDAAIIYRLQQHDAYGRAPGPLDEPTLATIRQSAIEGQSVTAIANRLDISRTAVSKVLDDAGIARARFNEPGGGVLRIFEPAPWTEAALCAQTDPEAFFPEKGGSTRQAIAVCRRCPVAAECLDYALTHHERHGIWGGVNERKRRKLAELANPNPAA